MRTPVAAGLRAGHRIARTGTICLVLIALIATPAPAGAGGARSANKTVSIVCRGGGNSCSAVASVAGGASNETLRIALSDTDLKLVGVVAKPAFIHGAYMLSRGSYSLGGSLYTVRLNAVRSIPRGATLTLRFAAPAQRRG
jgi:uncharacterized protein (DUF1501 family)